VNVTKAVEKALGLPQALILGKTDLDLTPQEAADLLRRQDVHPFTSPMT
jgi:hypothetical protein